MQINKDSQFKIKDGVLYIGDPPMRIHNRPNDGLYYAEDTSGKVIKTFLQGRHEAVLYLFNEMQRLFGQGLVKKPYTMSSTESTITKAVAGEKTPLGWKWFKMDGDTPQSKQKEILEVLLNKGSSMGAVAIDTNKLMDRKATK